MEVLKHFAPLGHILPPWVIFWSERIETFLDKNCLTFFWSKYLSQFSIKIIIKTWYSSKYDQGAKYVPGGRMFHFYNSSINTESISLF